MSYTKKDFEKECKDWEKKHGKRIYLNNTPPPNWMKKKNNKRK